ncbi:hypothetical protein BD289DRAFT_434290 [Coniella lustricola]|uniref:Chromo domain-containing protein n=1 Tax=Coniella lustricola TaxID=2025994 RepID=A0A2T3A7S3_9PEZI|nr:hypothetical protein BD289DRAFT_434290 [Coniella lustricola]
MTSLNFYHYDPRAECFRLDEGYSCDHNATSAVEQHLFSSHCATCTCLSHLQSQSLSAWAQQCYALLSALGLGMSRGCRDSDQGEQRQPIAHISAQHGIHCSNSLNNEDCSETAVVTTDCQSLAASAESSGVESFTTAIDVAALQSESWLKADSPLHLNFHVPEREWAVRKIKEKAVIDNEVFYKVAWECTWEPESNVKHLREWIERWK